MFIMKLVIILEELSQEFCDELDDLIVGRTYMIQKQDHTGELGCQKWYSKMTRWYLGEVKIIKSKILVYMHHKLKIGQEKHRFVAHVKIFAFLSHER